MRSDYRKLGGYIRQMDERNSDLSITNLQGVSIAKEFVPSIANIIGTDLSTYKIVRTGQFAYGPVTSRNGDKVSIALLKGKDCIISSSYSPFEVVKPDELLPEYLMLWFMRPEFDRYARFMSNGSAREVFDWESMCGVELPVPPIPEQRKIVRDYQVITERIKLLHKENGVLIHIAKNLYKQTFSKNDYPKISMSQLCSKIGSGATPRGGKESYCKQGTSLIRSTNVYDYTFSYKDLAHISKEQANALSNVTVNHFDILFNITGVSIARCCMVPPNVLPARVNQHVMILRPKAGKYMSYYLLLTLCEPSNKKFLLGIGQSGSTRDAINKQEMEDFKISLPPQEEINAFGKQVELFFYQSQCIAHEIEVLQSVQQLLLSRL